MPDFINYRITIRCNRHGAKTPRVAVAVWSNAGTNPTTLAPIVLADGEGSWGYSASVGWKVDSLRDDPSKRHLQNATEMQNPNFGTGRPPAPRIAISCAQCKDRVVRHQAELDTLLDGARHANIHTVYLSALR